MLLAKLAERSPIKYNLARNTASLSPIKIVKNKEEYGVRFCSLADKLHAVNNVKASVFVVLSCNMKSLQIISIFIVKMSFWNLMFHLIDLTHSLDFICLVRQNMKAQWSVCILVFTLSLGQSNIERGFSIDKEILVENLETNSLIAWRLVFENLKSEQIKSN